jgi:hypothetical protein
MPRAPKFCGSPGCTARVVGRPYCVDHQPIAWGGGQKHTGTWAWRKLRQQVLDEEPVCRDCYNAPATQAGHILGRAYGGLDVRENLKGQCAPCNLEQMRQDKIRYAQ